MAMAPSASAINVTMNAADLINTSSFNTALHWDNAQLPSPGNNYFTGAFTIRTPNTAGQTYVFGGDSLTLDAGGRLLGKPTGAQTLDFGTGAGLILNGGALHMANGASDTYVLTVLGNIKANGASSLGALGFGANDTANFETLDIGGTISGTATLTVAGTANNSDNTGVVRLSGANPFSGTMTVAQPKFVSSATNRLLQLNNLNALQNATLQLSATAPNPVSFTAAANTGPFKVGALTGTSNQRLVDTANAAVALDFGSNGADSSYQGVLSGIGSIVKSGAGTMALNGLNTYTGNTTVNAGTLSLYYANLDDASTVRIATGAKLHLPHGLVDKVSSLVLNNVPQPAGVYNSSTPGGYITGSGSIEVSSGTPGPLTIVMKASDPGTATVTTSINGDIGNWSVAGAPVAPNNYYTGPFTLRTPATLVNQDLGTFPGTILSVDTGGRLLGKAGSGAAGNTAVQRLNVNLELNGGNIDQAGSGGSQSTLILGGTVKVRRPAFVGAVGTSDGVTKETLEFAGVISGDAELTVAGPSNGSGNRGTVRLSAANTYTGFLSVFHPGGDMADTVNRLLQLNHKDAVKFAELNLATNQDNPVSFTPAANTGPFNVGAFSGASNQILSDTAGAPVTLSIGGNGGDYFFLGNLTGNGGIIKAGQGVLTLSGQNTYTGNTTVSQGTLNLPNAGLSDTSTVSVAAGATLELFHTETDVVGSLILDGVAKAPGIYDSTNSGGRIVGSGKLQVMSAPAAGFSAYMDTFAGLSAADKLPNADPDHDGVTNLVEYALGGFDPTVPNNFASAFSNGTLTFTKRAAAVTNGDVTYSIQTSTNLGGSPSDWTTVTPSVNDATTISFTLPTGQGKIFARLRVVKN